MVRTGLAYLVSGNTFFSAWSLQFERAWRKKTSANQIGRAAIQRIDEFFQVRINNVRAGLMQSSSRATSGRDTDAKQFGLTGSPDQGIIRGDHNYSRLPRRQNRQLTRSTPWVLMETVEPIHEFADSAALENGPTCVQIRAEREASAGTVARQFSQSIGAPRSPLELGDVLGCLHFELEPRAIGLDKTSTSTEEKVGLPPFRPNQAPERRLVQPGPA